MDNTVVYRHNINNLYSLRSIASLCEQLCKVVEEYRPEMVENLVLAKYNGLDVVFKDGKLHIVVPMPCLFDASWEEATDPLLDMVNRDIKFWELKD